MRAYPFNAACIVGVTVVSIVLCAVGFAQLSPRELDLAYHRVNECGIISLYVVSRYEGKQLSLSALREICPTTIEGTSIRNLVDAAGQIGLPAVPYSASVGFLRAKGGPGIVDYPKNHFCVFLGWVDGKIMLLDPPFGTRTVTKDEFVKAWGGHVILFERSAR